MIERSFLSLNSHGFHNVVYSDWGPEDGDIIICVHGLTGNGHDFDEIAPKLVEDGYRVIAPDLPGRGRSDFLQNPLDYNYTQYWRDLSALMVQLNCVPRKLEFGLPEATCFPGRGKSVDWLGVSLGGLLGIYLAALPHSPIRRLILNDVGPEVPKPALDFIKQVISQEYTFDTLPDLEKRMRETRGLTWGPVTDAQWKHMAEHNARALPDGKITYGYDPQISKILISNPSVPPTFGNSGMRWISPH
ncbi:MAG: alpha/beta fold hydrolase [Alphaproteobacteria bacterium]|nr:alpha/beta fold hydrolase [Alphaproteobacteria bacterium]